MKVVVGILFGMAYCLITAGLGFGPLVYRDAKNVPFPEPLRGFWLKVHPDYGLSINGCDFQDEKGIRAVKGMDCTATISAVKQ